MKKMANRRTPHGYHVVNRTGAPPTPPPTRHRATLVTQPAEQEVSMSLPNPGSTVSYAADIKPLFREGDRHAMRFAFDLWSYADVRTHAAAILGRLEHGTMPCDGAWPADRIALFRRWLAQGTPA
jgi:hypothetical protein